MTLGSQKGGQEESLTTQMDGWRSRMGNQPWLVSLGLWAPGVPSCLL